MVHSVPAEWHDLIEDPTDLPKEVNCYQVTLMPKEISGGNFDIYREPIIYWPESKVWKEDYYDGNGNFERDIFYESYGSVGFKLPGHKVSDEFVVVAWAKRQEPYIPQKLQGG